MRLAFAVAVGLWVGAPPGPEQGTEAWRAVKRRIAHDRVRAKYLRDEEASILGGLAQIERRLARHHRRIRELEEQLAGLDLELERLRETRSSSEAELDRLRETAGRRAAAMLRLRRTSVGRLVREARDPIEARLIRDRFRFVLAHDTHLLRAARTADDAFADAQAGLETARASFEAAKGQLVAEIEEEALLEEERRALAEAVREERRAAERLLRELAGAARSLEREMTRLRGTEPAPEAVPGGFAAQRGRLPWPATGRVEVTFGKRVDPRSDVVLLSKGIDVRADANSPVRAVFDGKVAFAGTFEGYGRMVIIAHAGGYHTLYAHLERSVVSVGDAVAQHRVIGYVGDSGSTKGTYLYFELRQGREAVDPLRWLDDR